MSPLWVRGPGPPIEQDNLSQMPEWYRGIGHRTTVNLIGHNAGIGGHAHGAPPGDRVARRGDGQVNFPSGCPS
jgi:hypothetical protein